MKKLDIPFSIKSAGSDAGTYVFVASDSTVDRDGDSLDQSKWDFRNYLKNPVILWGHDYYSPPIGKCVSMSLDGGRLVMEVKFASEDEYAFAATIEKLVSGGYVNTCSVGFISHDDGSMELLELSIVSVPANPNAVRLAFDEGVISDSEADEYVAKLFGLAEKITNRKSMAKHEKSGARHSRETIEKLEALKAKAEDIISSIEEMVNDPEGQGGRGEDDGASSEGKSADPEKAGKETHDQGNGTDPEAKSASADGAEDGDVSDEQIDEEGERAYMEAFNAELEKLSTGKVE